MLLMAPAVFEILPGLGCPGAAGATSRTETALTRGGLKTS